MTWLALLCSIGVPAGLLLLRRVPLCPQATSAPQPGVSILIPARNEEVNLPRLLGSIQQSAVRPAEVVVVDDHSADRTAEIAGSYGARVVTAQPLPSGWTGKTWACAQGADAAGGSVFLFLDADTWFAPGGYERLLSVMGREPDANVAISLLPWHVMEHAWEQFSLFFHLLMAMGAGGFGWAGKPRLFGQSLLLTREFYEACGGHAGVRQHILENLMLASRVEAAGGRTHCLGGRGTLHIRMFPEGFAQMSEAWTKAFAAGAAASGALLLAVSVLWISAIMSTFLLLILPTPLSHGFLAALYLCYAVQIAWMARQIGSYHWITCLLYPIPLLYYMGIFGRSFYLRALGRTVTWRGREI